MRPGLLLALLPALALAGDPPDPVAALPAALRPGSRADFERAAQGGVLRGRVAFSVTRGKAPGTVRILREYRTGKLGPLTRRDRFTAVLEARTRRIRTFTLEEARGERAALRTVARLRPAPKKPGVFVHERYRYPKSGAPRVTRSRKRLPGRWVPDLLEPFLVPLLGLKSGETAAVRVLRAREGRLGKVPVAYRRLGEGKMDAGGAAVVCLILLRTEGKARARLYLRKEDGMVFRAPAAGLTLLSPPRKEPGKKSEGRGGSGSRLPPGEEDR